MKTAAALLFAILISAAGCEVSRHLLPAGSPRVLGQIFSVMLGFGGLALRMLP